MKCFAANRLNAHVILNTFSLIGKNNYRVFPILGHLELS